MSEMWINFKELRERLSVTEILASYNVTVKIKGDQAQGFCPLPAHPKHDGKKKSPSFSVNLKRGIFQCFSCRTSGNVLDLVCLLEGMNPKVPGDIRRAAILLEGRYASADPARPPKKPVPPPPEQKAPIGEQKVVVNAPLDFELKHLDPDHPYLFGRGFSPEMIEHFGLGFCDKGLMKGRIAIPLHDAGDNLIGYAGRLVNDAMISDENPKYRFPGTRERKGSAYEFHKSEFLYNGSGIKTPVKELVIVEGFPSTWWLWQHGHTAVVGLMGNSCSETQAKLIVNMTAPDGLVTILTDGDDAGVQCAHSIFFDVAPHRTVRWAKLHSDQPTDLTPKELNDLLR